jgi:hypothetical protein
VDGRIVCNWDVESSDSGTRVCEIDMELLYGTAWSTLIQITAIGIVHKYNMQTNRSVHVEPRGAEQQQRQEDLIIRIITWRGTQWRTGLQRTTAEF